MLATWKDAMGLPSETLFVDHPEPNQMMIVGKVLEKSYSLFRGRGLQLVPDVSADGRVSVAVEEKSKCSRDFAHSHW